MRVRTLTKILIYVCAGMVGCIVLLLLAVKLALDRAPQYQAEIKRWVHGQIGYQINFKRVSPELRWHGPEIYFDQLELRSEDGLRVLAKARGGRVAADLWQLLFNGKLLAGRIELDSPSIMVERVAPDKFLIASEIAFGGGASSAGTRTLGDFPLGSVAIRHGFVTIENWNPALPQLILRDVSIDLRRGFGSAGIDVGAKLPPQLGSSVSVNVSARGLGRVDMLDWRTHIRTRDISFAGWRRLLPQYLSRLDGGTGGFDISAHGVGSTLARADLDFDAHGIKLEVTDEPGAKFDQVSGLLRLTHAGERWTLTGRRVRALRAGRRDPESEFDVGWRANDLGLTALNIRANYLRAEALLPLAGLLPQKDLRERLQEAAPTGEWMGLHVDLSRGTVLEQWKLQVQSRFRAVGFAPWGRSPGLRGLTGSVAGNQDGGRVDIDTRTAVFSWPIELPGPVAIENLKTTLYWKRTAAQLLVATSAIDVKTRDANLSARASWRRSSDNSSPILVVAGAVDDGNAGNVHYYFPRTLLPTPALAWLNRAFVAGHLSHADVVIDGPVRQFPFRDGTGLFLVRAHVDGGILDYREGWPRAEDLSLQAEFRNEGLHVQLLKGRLGNLAITRGDATFEDLRTGELQINGTTSGDATAALDYLRATPLDAMAEHLFSGVTATGPQQSTVSLFLPFRDFDHRRMLVHTHLSGVSLNRTGSTLAATDLVGDADIDGGRVARSDVHGKLLGGPFQMQSRVPSGTAMSLTTFSFAGTFSGEVLHAALALPGSVVIAGMSDWQGALRLGTAPRERSLHLSTSLVGLESKLPEPLTKPAHSSWPTTVDVDWPSTGGPAVRVALGSVVRGRVILSSDAGGPTLSRAAVTFGRALPATSSSSSSSDAQGEADSAPTSSGEPLGFSDSQVINTGGSIDRLDLGGWLKLFAPDQTAKPLVNFLRFAKFEVNRIDYLGLAFSNLSISLSLADNGWHVGIGGPNVVGSLSLPSAADLSQPWKFEFQQLKFDDATDGVFTRPGASPGGAGANLAGTISNFGTQSSDADPRSIPAIDFHAANVIWGERELGAVQATLRKLNDGISLKELNLTSPSFSASIKGEWRGRDAGVGRAEGTLASNDLGATLKQLGYQPVIEAKAGKMDFDISWIGAPSSGALTLADGHVQLSLDKGQITGLKPGAGRVVGLASLAALPRRLALDFSDLTDKGLAFDTVRGDFDIRDGSAFTDNVLVKGPAAEIGLIGRIGLKNKDYDQTAVVTGNVSGSLPLAAFVGGPVIGAAVLVFTQVFKQPLNGLARGYYRITGGWDNPIVERIKSAEAAEVIK